MTQFFMKDERLNDLRFKQVERTLYKKVISISVCKNQPIRTGTQYTNGVPQKFLTLLKR